MLSDPISATIGGSLRSLARRAPLRRSSFNAVQSNTYGTSDGTYTVDTRQYAGQKSGTRRAEIFLRKTSFDVDSNTNYDGEVAPAVGLVFEWGPNNLGVSDISALRTDLLALVDSTLQGRLLAGES